MIRFNDGGRKQILKVIGIDLSGPANHKDTVLTVFQVRNNLLLFENMLVDVSDEMIISTIIDAAKGEDVAVGIDAPLSYQDGGGDRPQDKSIRQFIKSFGLSGSSIMPPTLTKMVYLTLRGISLTRRIMSCKEFKKIRLVEVHPGAAIGVRLGTEDLYHALHYKKELESSKVIFDWFNTIGLSGLPNEIPFISHQIDACAAALAAWYWADPAKQPKWLWNKTSPVHPFEYCC
jgi:predicted nuclease with RNAse H fold